MGKQIGKNKTWAKVCCEEGAGDEGAGGAVRCRRPRWWALCSSTGCWRGKWVFHPHRWAVGELYCITGPPPILPSSLKDWEPGKPRSQQHAKSSWTRSIFAPLGRWEGLGEDTPRFCQLGWAMPPASGLPCSPRCRAAAWGVPCSPSSWPAREKNFVWWDPGSAGVCQPGLCGTFK